MAVNGILNDSMTLYSGLPAGGVKHGRKGGNPCVFQCSTGTRRMLRLWLTQLLTPTIYMVTPKPGEG